MTRSLVGKAGSAASTLARNPHFWVMLALTGVLLFVYQAWPWPPRQFTDGIWRFFPWLSNLRFLVPSVELRFHIVGVLFFIPIIYGCLTLSWPGGAIAWLLSLIWVLPTLLSWTALDEPANLLLLFLPVLLVAVVNAERRWREGQKRYFAERERERQAYVAKLVETQEQERHRIAQELHDGTLQTLLGIANRLDALASTDNPHEHTTGNLWARQKLLESMADVRRLSMNLRPSVLDNLGLVSGIRWLVSNKSSQQTCRIKTRVKGKVRKMSSLAEVTLFRVAQEAVTNIERHAQAQTASIIMEFGDEQLTLEIRDDGVGFETLERSALYRAGKLGIVGMEQRILSVGGAMQLESHPGQGTKLVVTLPYDTSDEVIEGEKA